MGGRKESKRQAGEEEQHGSGKARESIAGGVSGVERPRTHAWAYHHFLYIACLIATDVLDTKSLHCITATATINCPYHRFLA